MSNSVRNVFFLNRREMVGFGGNSGSAAVSSQLHIVHTYESRHSKGEPWNSIMKAAAPTFQKRQDSLPSFT